MTTPAMVLNDVRYIERRPNAAMAEMARLGACAQCAFIHDTFGCYHATAGGLGERAFGGDCMARDVVYVHAEDPR